MSTGAGAAGAAGAAAAGQAGGDAGQAAADGQNGQAQGLDPAQINEALETLRGGQEELRELFSQQPDWAQALTAQPQDPNAPDPNEPATPDLSFLDDPLMDPRQQAEQLAALIQQGQQTSQEQVQQAIQQALAPVTQRLDQREQAEAAAEFVAEFPEVGDPKVAKEVMELSRDYAAQLNMPEMGNNYRFARLVFAATKAFDAAAEEGSGDPGAAHLEGGGGANPGGGPQEDQFDRMLKTKRGSSVLPFG